MDGVVDPRGSGNRSLTSRSSFCTITSTRRLRARPSAVVLEASDEVGPALLGFDLGVDGTARHILDCDHGALIHMDGREVFRRAVRAVVASATKAMERAGVTANDIAWFVPHQANIRIIESVCEKIDVPMERAVTVLGHYGNTSVGSIPLALVSAIDDGRATATELRLERRNAVAA